MDAAAIPVNWESLDALVMDFARSERLIEEEEDAAALALALPLPLPPASPPSSPSSSSSSPSSSSSYGSRLANRQIRRSLEAGDVDAAVELLRSHAPFVLDDRRILFRLQKQVSRFGLLFSGGREGEGEVSGICRGWEWGGGGGSLTLLGGSW